MKFNHKINGRRSIRLKEFDNSQPGAYFVTLATHRKECLFGNVVNGHMVLNDLGCIAKAEWLRSAEIRREVEIDQYVIMPNHIHGIVVLNGLWATRRSPLQSMPRGPSKRSLSAFVAGFKSTATIRINKLSKPGNVRIWQRNYYEHIVRNEAELDRVRRYIEKNPIKWDIDPENPQVGATGGSPIPEEPWHV